MCQWLRNEILNLLREDWMSAWDLAWETGAPYEEVEKVLDELEEEGLVFRDGPLYLHRMGRV